MPSSIHSTDTTLELPRATWPTIQDLQVLPDPTVIPVGSRCIYEHSPTTVFKLTVGAEEEGIMTALAHSVLGPIVLQVHSLVTIAERPHHAGLLLTRQPGQPAASLWSSLTPDQRAAVKTRLCDAPAPVRLLRVAHRRRSHKYGALEVREQPQVGEGLLTHLTKHAGSMYFNASEASAARVCGAALLQMPSYPCFAA